MTLKNFHIAVLVTFLCSGSAFADTWWEVRTDHFRMISNLYRTTTSDIARGLVLFDAAVGEMLQSANLSPSAPITIYLVDGRTWHTLISDRKMGGFVEPREHASYVWIYGDTWPDPQRTVFHEMGHIWLASNRTRAGMPAWHNEGFAELVSTMRIVNSKVWVGASPQGHWRTLRTKRWIPLEQMFAMDIRGGHSPDISYPLAWVIEHYRTFAKTPEAEQLTAYLQLLNSGGSSEVALQQSFPTGLDTLQKELKNYARKTSFDAFVAPIPDSYQTYEPSVEKISATKAAEAIGEWVALQAQPTDAQLKFLDEQSAREPSTLLALQTALIRLRRSEIDGDAASQGCKRDLTDPQEAIACADIEMARDTGNRATWSTAHQMYARAIALEPDNLRALLGAGITADLSKSDLQSLIAGLERAYQRNRYNMTVAAELAWLLSTSDTDKAREYLHQAILNGLAPSSVVEFEKFIDGIAGASEHSGAELSSE